MAHEQRMGGARHRAMSAGLLRGGALQTPAWRLAGGITPAALARLAAPALAIGLVIILVLLPFAVARHGAPPGFVFRGTLKPSGDESQYLAAVRMGQAGDWLWHDPYMARPPAPILMYPVYLGAGHLAALLGFDMPSGFALLHALAALILCCALWRLADEVLPPRERPWLLVFGLGAGGLYWLVGVLTAMDRAPVDLSRMGSQGLSGFTALLMEAHEALAVAGQVLALAGMLGAQGRGGRARLPHLLYGAGGTLLIGLSMPVLLPLALLTLASTWGWWLRSSTIGRPGPGTGCRVSSGTGTRARVTDGDPRAGGGAPAAAVVAAMVPQCQVPALCLGVIALPGGILALYYARLFGSGPWAEGQFRAVPAIPAQEQALLWGILLPLAVWGWRRAAAVTRPVADALAIWAGGALIGAQLPFWQGSRLTAGMAIVCGALFALGLHGAGTGRPARVRWLAALSLGPVSHYLFLLTALAGGNAPHLYNTAAEDQAARWLATHARADDVVVAPFGFANVLPTVAAVRVVAGHTYQTLDLRIRVDQVRGIYGADQSPAAHLTALRASGATLVVYDRLDGEDGPFDPGSLPGLRRVFASGDVAVSRVGRLPGG